MAFKFNEITFDFKDILLIVGLVAGYFNFKSEQNEKFNELKLEIKQIVSDNKLQEVKYNARFDMLSKPMSERKTNKHDTISFTAIVYDTRIKVKSLDDRKTI